MRAAGSEEVPAALSSWKELDGKTRVNLIKIKFIHVRKIIENLTIMVV